VKEIDSYPEIPALISKPGMSLLYISRPSCGVCTALKPKVEALLESFPGIICRYVNLDNFPEVCGQLSVFTVPAILVYSEGRELVREARYMSVDDLKAKIERPYGFIFASGGN
jgi:thioredoxin-like negative regulator of GroEL